MRSILNGLLVSLMFLACVACGSEEALSPQEEKQSLKVVASYSIIGDLVQQVGGEHVSVVTLVGADGDAHTYQPTPKDSVALNSAKLVFENGLGFESWLDDLYEASGSTGKRVVVTQAIKKREIEHDHDHHDHHHHHHHEVDPHVWHDVPNAIAMVNTIADALAEADPANKAAYHANRDRYVGELKELDAWVREQVQTIPEARRVLVTTHDSFGYFADRYGFKTVTILGSASSEMADPNAAAFAKVVKQIKDSGVPAVFAENILNPRLTKRVAREAGVKLPPSLYTGALGKKDSDGETYFKMIRHNVKTIVEALR